MEECLIIHHKLVSDEMKPHHMQLQNGNHQVNQAFERNFAQELSILRQSDSTSMRISNLDFLRELVANNHVEQSGVLKGITNSLYIPGVNDDSMTPNIPEMKEPTSRKKKHWSILSFQAPNSQTSKTLGSRK